MVRTKKAARKNSKMPANHPPLPPGPPPRQSGYDSYSRNGDSYGSDNYRPSPGRGDTYQPRGAPMYQFGAGNRTDDYNSYRPSYEPRRRSPSPPPRSGHAYNGSSYRPSNQNDRAMANSSAYRGNPGGPNSFDFRYDAPPGLDYHAAESRRRSPPRQNFDNNRRQTNNAYRGGARGGHRGRGGPRLASEREFLKTNRAPTPELMPGMDEDLETGAKYKSVDDVSDSDEVDMDMSDDGDEDQEPRKKQARGDGKAADGDSVPRWSNPDPYTALPPPDETRAKKKDVVKLIRKARVTSNNEHASKPAAADDFISFDFGDDEEQEQDEDDMAHGFNRPSPPRGPREIAGSFNDFNPPRGPAIQQLPQPRLPLPKKPEFTNQSRSNDTSFIIKQNGTTPVVSKTNVIDLTSDPALGSRKRDIRDEIKPAPILHSTSKGKPGKVNGQILKDWVARPDLPAAPWLGMDHSDSAGVGVWLHKEIMDFYEYVRPRDFEQVIRQRLIDDLQARATRNFDRNCEIRPFGSFPAGLFLPTADMDLVCVSRDFLDRGSRKIGQGLRGLFKFRDFIQSEGLALNRQIELISGAKVPLVKYVDKLTGLKVDISFENDTGLIANNTFQAWKREFPAMPILVTLIKHLLAMRGLNEPVNGGIGGFSVTCLVVSLLQHMPQVQSRSMTPEHHLGEIFMEFLDLYGNEFNTTTTAISVNPPAYIRKDEANIPYKGIKSKFMIIDPNRPDNDISGGSSNTEGIRRCFSQAYDQLARRSAELQRSYDRNNKSLLECIIGGNYRSFELQRAHLAHVHEKLYLQK